MIIGISGKKQHGKDTVASIIEYLSNEYHHHSQIVESYEDYLYMRTSYKNFPKGYIPHWQIKRFADKLKDIVCLLIGCTREQLEDNDFKEKELGEEWWYYKELDSGLQHPNFTPLVPYTTDFINNGRELIESVGRVKLIKLTPRLLLQLIGTECGRKIIHPNIWVNATMSEYKPTIDNLIKGEGYQLGEVYPNWLITDVRFENEVKAIKDKGGVVIRVNRFGMPEGDTHESETALDSYKDFDATIENNSDIRGLIDQLEIYLHHIKVIK